MFLIMQYIQSENFAQLIQKKFAPIIKQRYAIDASFERLELSIFPPASAIRDLHIKIPYEGKMYELNASKAKAVFQLTDLFKSNLTLGEVVLEDATLELPIKIKFKKSKEEQKKISDADFSTVIKKENFDEVKAIQASLPVRVNKVSLIDVRVRGENFSMCINYLSASSFAQAYELDLDLEEIVLPEINIDYVTLNALFGPELFNVSKLKIGKELESIEGSIKIIPSTKFMASQVEGKIHAAGRIDHIMREVKKYIKAAPDLEGYASAFVRVSGELLNPEINIESKMTKLKTLYSYSENIDSKITYKDKSVSIDQLIVSNKEEKLQLTSPVNVISNGKLLDVQDAHISLNQFPLDKVLYWAKERIPRMDGGLTGQISLSLSKKKLYINMLQIKVDNFIMQSNSRKKVLELSDFRLEKSHVDINFEEGVRFGGEIKDLGGDFVFQGSVENKINIKASSNSLDFSKFGKIGGMPIEGKGPIRINVLGSGQDISMDIKGKSNGFQILELNLGDLDLDLNLDFKGPLLSLKKVEGFQGATSYVGTGYLNFEHESGGYDINIDVLKGTYRNIAKVLENKVSLLTKIADYAESDLKGKARIFGKFSDEYVGVSTNVALKYVQFLSEDLSSGQIDLEFGKGVLSFSKIKFKKEAGGIEGKLSVDLKTKYFEYDVEMSKILLTSLHYYNIFNLGLDGLLNGEFYGSGTFDDFTSKTILTLRNSKIRERKYEDSSLKIYQNRKDVFLNGNIAGNLVNLSSFVNADPKSKKKSFLNFRISSSDIKDFLGFFSHHNLDNKSLRGGVDADMRLEGSIFEPQKLDMDLKINRFFTKTKDHFFQIKDNSNSIVIKQGKVEEWNIEIEGPKHYLYSYGQGDIKEGVKVETKFFVPVDLISMLTPQISYVDGSLEGRVKTYISPSAVDIYYDFVGQQILLKMVNFPMAIEDTNVAISGTNNRIFLHELNGKLSNGPFKISGNMDLRLPYPRMDFNFELSKALIPLMKKSSIVVSLGGRIAGKAPPYNVNANASLVFGEIVDELNEIIFSQKDSSKKSIKSLAPTVSSHDWLDLNVGFSTAYPAYIKNSLMELFLEGNIAITGSEKKPRIAGNVAIIPIRSKLFFKGHEFVISKGNVTFNKGEDYQNPSIEVLGTAKINKYSLFVDAYGSIKTLSLNFKADPPLPQEDILSLLTLGITPEVSKGLQSSDLQSVTSVSVGTLLMEQFGVNENLNRSLGLKLSVLPEFSTNTATPIQGRASTSEGAASRVRSSTKIRLQKRVKDFDFIFASTVGGSIQQKQEMNINYDLSEKISVQGVWEVRSSDSVGTSQTPNSVGMDFIWKKTFK